jgi:glyoxylase-like metal-dependent hydrolase (beta-lactamase superfamily II)
MYGRGWRILVCFSVLGLAAWLRSGDEPAAVWKEVQPGVWQSPGLPCAYALVADGAALVIDAPHGADLDTLKRQTGAAVDQVWLTHHNRDTCARAAAWKAAGLAVKGPKAGADWLTPAGVTKYWAEALPLRNSRTSYLVLPEGIPGLDLSLEDGQTVAWHGWEWKVVATPGHSRDHLAFTARKGAGPLLAFVGDALAAPGQVWSPYTTDWDHWTDLGLKPTAESLRKLAALQPAALFPAHGAPITAEPVQALERTAKNVEEVGFLKSYERFTKERLGNAPPYAFLAKEQAGSAGEKPWSRLSDHLFYTGNTYVLVSRDNRLLVFDPWGKRSVDQVRKVQADHHLGPVERVLFSHAHFDHYDGVYDLADRDRFQVWALDAVARPIGEPLYFRAPFLDARPVTFDRQFADGESATWHEYTFKFRHLPGQTWFAMGVETDIDGKRCYFTGDNFFHVDLYSGTGGWMGLNRSWPDGYAESARKVLDARPEWVLAEHGGAFAFDAEDFRRREAWGRAAAKAADALCPSGTCRYDWNPHRVQVEPLLLHARPGQELAAAVVATNPLDRPESLDLSLAGRGVVADVARALTVPAGGTAREKLGLKVAEGAKAGRYVLPLRAVRNGVEDGSDTVVVVEVK